MENKRLFGRICCLQRHMSRENNFLFAEYGITPVQMDALLLVLRRTRQGEKVCQKDIEKHVNLRASSVSTLLTTLEKKGYLVRKVSDGDARTKYLTLTEKGNVLCEEKKLYMDRCDALVQSALTEDEQETFITLLNKIMSGINPEKEDTK